MVPRVAACKVRHSEHLNRHTRVVRLNISCQILSRLHRKESHCIKLREVWRTAGALVIQTPSASTITIGSMNAERHAQNHRLAIFLKPGMIGYPLLVDPLAGGGGYAQKLKI